MPGGDGQVRRPRLPDAGWLPDPSRLDMERWWDGRRWTDRTRGREVRTRWGLSDEAALVDLERDVGGAVGGLSPAVPEPSPEVREGWLQGWRGGFALVGVLVLCMLVYASAVSGRLGSLSAWELQAPAGPAVEYPVFAADSLSLYLARSLMVQQPEIDLSWLSRAGADEEQMVADAMLAVVIQNPYVFADGTDWTLTAGGDSLVPTYLYDSDEAERRRRELQAEVTGIVHSDAVSQATGQVALAQAVHDAIIARVTLDEGSLAVADSATGTAQVAAFTQAQQAYGALVQGRASSLGYAQAFQVLADAVGLTTVVVTGSAYDGAELAAHAWNKVQMSGVWITVDVAWDDGGAEGALDDWFLVPDGDPRLDDRAPDSSWMLDERLMAYGA
ncbi:DUF2510 domain-containing protein [Demequina capsici]|uniref:DUF2510 domain-containing protein n=1 Tax=Demequina capsici TaxID=3075620 RepID=A0AA96J9I4_9MICO|nr:DUF2510 domain-containing protein [Demequina sp. OYTSA14]WNM23536.1 DUF2510 domain-containing protein [Demequina sp. OYTSA14]